MEESPMRQVAGFGLAILFAGLAALAAPEALGQQTQPTRAPLATSRKEYPLSMKRAILLALKNNLQIAVQRYGPSIASTDVEEAKAAFDPEASTSLTFQDIVTPADARVRTFGGVTRTEDEEVDFQASIQQKFALGTDVELVASNLRTANTFNLFESDYETDVTLSIRQPLLKDFGPTVNRSEIIIAQKSQAMSQKEFEEAVIDIIARVQKTYWDLVFAIEDLKVKKRSLQLAQDLLERNKIQVEVGTLAPIEVVQAEAAVAQREADVIVAQDALRDAQDRLKRLLNLFDDPQARDATIVPVDRPSFAPKPVDLEKAIDEALANRPDYARANLELEQAELNLRVARNQLLPQLDFVGEGGYSANRGNLGNSLDDIFDAENRHWSLGVEISVPMGNRKAKADYTRRTLELWQVKTKLEDLKQAIRVEVREAVRQLETDIKRVKATRAARVLAEKKLEAEEKKLEVGISTNFQVLEFQEDLAQAESDETRAIIDYNKSLIALEQAKGTLLVTHNITLRRRAP
jgi:outer membrane protein TolC